MLQGLSCFWRSYQVVQKVGTNGHYGNTTLRIKVLSEAPDHLENAQKQIKLETLKLS
ncbi:hypothetical protein [Enterovibrio nigricans]|uniref:Uncharacterized protein n=1 Tax=Enterovibrio nigricans DSM 22720 TaxID=1121868 RepID=A0A1T4UJI7_9GAMM|nr:hypothetical protein [Enterovibrio nigricans]SKA52760.1 hypothetical protein SAMN02745132_01873 [Enterovibrio nigricans DSM 22720]